MAEFQKGNNNFTNTLREFIKYLLIVVLVILLVPASCIGCREYFLRNPIGEQEYLAVFYFLFWVVASIVLLFTGIKYAASVLDYISRSRIDRTIYARETGIIPPLLSDSEDKNLQKQAKNQSSKQTPSSGGVVEQPKKDISESENLMYKMELWDLYFDSLSKAEYVQVKNEMVKIENLSEKEIMEHLEYWIREVERKYKGNFVLAYNEISSQYKEGK